MQGFTGRGWVRSSSEVYLFLSGLPATHLPLAQSASASVLVCPALPHAFSFLLRRVLRRVGGFRALEQCLSCYQTSALESWKGSTREGVPEKTNFRSRLMWEKACVHGGSFRDLGRGLGRPGPCP